MNLYLNILIITSSIFFSEIVNATPAIIPIAIQIYAQYKKTCPTGLVNVTQRIPQASPSIAYNRARREAAARNKENLTDTEYCFPILSNN